MKKYKEWNNLTDRQKIEYLKYEMNRPNLSIRVLVKLTFWMLLFSLLIIIMYVMYLTTTMTADLYTQLNATISQDSMNQIEAFGNLSQTAVSNIAILEVVFIVAYFLYYIYKARKYNRKWKVFLDSIEVKK